MTTTSHTSADASHYNGEAEHYDAFNEENSRVINTTVESILKEHGVHTVLDLTCGTGSQVFWLAEHGYDVVGSDFNQKMLEIARQKARAAGLDIKFVEGDMRSMQVGHFDAVITIFNAVGHLTKADFEMAMRNVHSNLNPEGLYIFDIFNLSYLLHENNITKLTIDWQKSAGNTTMREIQYSTIDEEGILESITTSYQWTGSEKPSITTHSQTLQVYTTEQLEKMLEQNGFAVLSKCDLDGSTFAETESASLVMVARSVV